LQTGLKPPSSPAPAPAPTSQGGAQPAPSKGNK
jgi:hypothetical protein